MYERKRSQDKWHNIVTSGDIRGYCQETDTFSLGYIMAYQLQSDMELYKISRRIIRWSDHWILPNIHLSIRTQSP